MGVQLGDTHSGQRRAPSRTPSCGGLSPLPWVLQGARQLAAAARAARAYTDTASFTLRCGVCQLGLRGEKEAVEHAKATGHTNFAEY